MKRAWIFGCAFALAGCNSTALNGGGKTSASPAPEKAKDPTAKDPASAPQPPPAGPPTLEPADPGTETTGAYLTECGTAEDERAQVTDAGATDVVYGCVVIDKTKAKLRDASITAVNARIANDAKAMILVQTEAQSAWHVLFPLVKADASALTGFDVTVKDPAGKVATKAASIRTDTATAGPTAPPKGAHAGNADDSNLPDSVRIATSDIVRYALVATDGSILAQAYEELGSQTMTNRGLGFQEDSKLPFRGQTGFRKTEMDLAPFLDGDGNVQGSELESTPIVRVRKGTVMAYITWKEFLDGWRTQGWVYEVVAFRLDKAPHNGASIVRRCPSKKYTDVYLLATETSITAGDIPTPNDWDMTKCANLGFEVVR